VPFFVNEGMRANIGEKLERAQISQCKVSKGNFNTRSATLHSHPPGVRDVAIAIVRGTTTYLCLCLVTRTPNFPIRTVPK
jgi:hypothetical protein